MEIFVRHAREYGWKMAPSSCERQRLFTDVTSDTERHFHFRAVGCGFEDV